MKILSRKKFIFFFIWWTGFFFLSCNDAKIIGTNQEQSGNNREKDAEDTNVNRVVEIEEIDDFSSQPLNVSGSYLTCANIGNESFGCALMSKNNKKLVASDMEWKIEVSKASGDLVQITDLSTYPNDNIWHISFNVPKDFLRDKFQIAAEIRIGTKIINCSVNIGSSPSDLKSFSTSEGEAHGEVVLYLEYPEDTSSIRKLSIWRLLGANAPNSDCQSDGEEIYSISDSFVSGPTVDKVTSENPPPKVSYLVCIVNSANELYASSIALDVQPRDLVPPQEMKSFSWTMVSLGENNTISLKIDLGFSDNLADLAEIRLKQIASGDEKTCALGSDLEVISEDFKDESLTKSLTAGNAIFACLYDKASIPNERLAIPVKISSAPLITSCQQEGTCNQYCVNLGLKCLSVGLNQNADDRLYGARCNPDASNAAFHSTISCARALSSTVSTKCRCQ